MGNVFEDEMKCWWCVWVEKQGKEEMGERGKDKGDKAKITQNRLINGGLLSWGTENISHQHAGTQ